eukprot:CAMPEP_0204897790 /NCGR_PEP_ID=MMETSP1397-20131031/929_1 /ASSEMBLY_ACC=CAM_ASM_000891 /TAXON_ID=49980 /ORGANISM="Climacostomum Climacostomum virens, Strain Stock W-24" /LENGTH=223 /DNA_ID=CAMNT_0052065567 /DNA_START=101 /DNA_END=769 /DNA_ORIENTATION=+
MPEDDKTEEYLCFYCHFEVEAECLVDGKPSCIECKTNKLNQVRSPGSSVRSERIDPPLMLVTQPSSTTSKRKNATSDWNMHRPTTSRAGDSATHTRSSSNVPMEQLKAHKFLMRYVNHDFRQITCLYDSDRDGVSSSIFHSRVDNKGGFIMVIKFDDAIEIAGYTWKGVRPNVNELHDLQSGGAVVNHFDFKLVSLADTYVINTPTGFQLTRSGDLVINLDNW